MLLLLFVVITDSRHIAMHFFHFRGILPVGSISRGKKQVQNRKKGKKKEVGNVDIGWAVGHTWCACTNVSLMTGNYDQGHRNTK